LEHKPTNTPEGKNPVNIIPTPCADPVVRDSLFFGKTHEDQAKAATMCFDCPLMTACAEKGAHEEYGVWGGNTEWDRQGVEPVVMSKAERDALIYAASEIQSATIVAIKFGVTRRTVVRVRASHRLSAAA